MLNKFFAQFLSHLHSIVLHPKANEHELFLIINSQQTEDYYT